MVSEETNYMYITKLKPNVYFYVNFKTDYFLLSYHLPLATVGSNLAKDFGFFHVGKLHGLRNVDGSTQLPTRA